MRQERDYQARLIERIEVMLPGCYVLKLSTDFIQGIPDLLILHFDRWVVLEVKRSAKEPYEPNQEYYIREFDLMSYSSMICPENEEEVLREVQLALQPRRQARVPKRQ